MIALYIVLAVYCTICYCLAFFAYVFASGERTMGEFTAVLFAPITVPISIIFDV
jgi:hypothetical protein